MATLQGLTEQEAIQRRNKGEGNNVELSTSRTYGQILRKNFLNPINLLLFILAGVMLALGRPSDAVSTGGLILLNALIGTFQEARAKRKLDKIALLTRPKVWVVRDGAEKEVDPSELVRGDILLANSGDQIVVDGALVSGKLEVDESQLTGESDLVNKKDGDEILSGSFVVTGKAYFEAQKVGAESFANKLTAEARKFTVFRTPLQNEIELVLRVMMGVAAFLVFLLFLSSVIYDLPVLRSVQLTAIIIGLIPVGLIFMVIVAYSLGAVRLIGEGALIQETNAVESLSNVDILCTDKTGTLTANRLLFNDLLAQDDAFARQKLGDFARSATATNKTGEAIAAGLAGQKRPFLDEVPFSSARKWSGLAFADGVYVLGALEMIRPYFAEAPVWDEQAHEWANQGLRVLGFAYNPDVQTLHDEDEVVVRELRPLALVSLRDELRPHVEETIQGFQEAGVQLKVISGDNPETVAALANQAGLGGDMQLVSGPELAKMDELQFVQAAEENTIFGRITPEQKEKLVDSLRQQGHYVAMTGDGVNDVLSLKKANLGIAMESGSAATRGVADILLLKDSFGALVPAFKEGQRILSGMTHIISLFLARTWTVALLIITTSFIRLGSPFLPNNNMIYAALTVGIPTFFLALWAESEKKPDNRLLHVVTFSAPAAILNMIFGTILFAAVFIFLEESLANYTITAEQMANVESVAGFQIASGEDAKWIAIGYVARSYLTVFLVLTGIVAILFVRPYFNFLAVLNNKTNDIKPTLMAIVMVLALIAVLLIEPLRNFFELVLLTPTDYLIIVALALFWSVLLWFFYRWQLLKKFFTIQ